MFEFLSFRANESNGGNFSFPSENSLSTVSEEDANEDGEPIHFNLLFTALIALVQEPPLKYQSYLTWAKFAGLFYPELEPIADQLVLQALSEFENENDHLIISAICKLFQKISDAEQDKNAQLFIIKRFASQLVQCFFFIASSADSPEPLSSETSENPFNIAEGDEVDDITANATETLLSIALAAPNDVIPIMAAIAEENLNAEQFGLREAAVSCLNIICQIAPPLPIIGKIYPAVESALNDPANRVKDAGLYLMQTIIDSILKNATRSPFVSSFPHFRQIMIHLATIINGLLDNPSVAPDAACALASFVRIPGFPLSSQIIQRIFTVAVAPDPVPNSGNPNSTPKLFRNASFSPLSRSAISALIAITSSNNPEVLQPLLISTLNIIEEALPSADINLPLISRLWQLVQKVLYTMSISHISEVDVEKIWALLSATASADCELTSILVPLATLSNVNPEAFLPHLPETIEILCNALHSTELLEYLRNVDAACLAITIISDSHDLTEYTPQLLQLLAGTTFEGEMDVMKTLSISDAITSLTKFPSFQACAIDSIAPIISAADSMQTRINNDNLLNLDDDSEKVIISYLKCFAATAAVCTPDVVEIPVMAAIDLLEVVGGLEEHGDDLITTSVDVMAQFVQQFPEKMGQMFQNEPGFKNILDKAIVAEIQLEKVHFLMPFFQE